MSPAAAPAGGKSREVLPGIVELFLPLPSRPTIINVWLLDCGGGEWALIDTGVALEPSRTAFSVALEELAIEPSAVTNLIATHHHPDHFGASEAYRADTGGKISLHPLELERIQYTLSAGPEDMIAHSRRHGLPVPKERVEAPSPAQVWSGTFRPSLQIDRFLEDGAVLELGKRRLQVVATPGHTPGHCCILDLETRTLFVGDHLLPKITPHVGIYATGPRNPLRDYVASLKKVVALDVRLVCPAHGAVYKDHRHRAQQLVAHHDYRRREMWDVILAAPSTAFMVARKCFDWVFRDEVNRFQAGAAVMETLAHLEMLRSEGRAIAEEREGVVYYRGTRASDPRQVRAGRGEEEPHRPHPPR